MEAASRIIYKNKCCVPDCVNKAAKRHRFPQDVELQKKWVENIKQPRLENLLPEQIYRAFYVCDIHFAAEYLVPGTKRGLRADAVPTLFLSALSEEVKENVEQGGEGENQATTSYHDVEPPVSSPEPCVANTRTTKSPVGEICPPKIGIGNVPKKRKGILQAVDVTRKQDLTPHCKKVYTVLGAWGRKPARVHLTVKRLKTRLTNAEKVANCPNFTNLLEGVNTTSAN